MRAGIPIMLLLFLACMTITAGEPVAEAGRDAVRVEFGIQNGAGIPTREFRQDETVRFVFRVRNTGSEAARLAYTFPPHDVAVLPSNDSNPVWQAWFGRMFAQVMRIESLPPGESVEFFVEWDLTANDGDPIPAGTWRVQPGFNAFLQPGNRHLEPDLPVVKLIIQ